MIESDLAAFIARHKLGVLGSISPEGGPQSALVGIAVTPQLEIVFDAVAASRKHRNLLANPSASFVIGWDTEVTLQYEGQARVPSAAELPGYQEIYFAAWPDGPSRLHWPGITYFVVYPTWIRYSDFTRQPPLIEEFSFSGKFEKTNPIAGFVR